jgi:hypothetical protein
LQVFRIIGTLKNRKEIDEGGGGTISNLGQVNYDPIKMMES